MGSLVHKHFSHFIISALILYHAFLIPGILLIPLLIFLRLLIKGQNFVFAIFRILFYELDLNYQQFVFIIYYF